MKYIAILFSAVLFVTNLEAQTFKQQFNENFSKKDTAAQRRVLENWEKTDNNDAELYTAYFNYYVNKSRKNVLTLGSNPGSKESFQLVSKDTSSKEEIFLYEDMFYDPELLRKGFDYINVGIQKFPARLDMRFGKIHMLGKIENYEPFTNNIIETIHYSAKINNQWTWTDNKNVEDPKNFMLGSIQGYILQLYDTEDDSLLDNMKRISEVVLIYYPDNIESLSDLSIVYLLQKDYDKALEVLLKAEKINPKDTIILNNIAQAYKLKGDKKNSIKYYEAVMKYGDEEAKKFSQDQINKLKNK